MLAGGMFELVRHNGGIDYIIAKITRHIHGKRGAEGIIASLVATIDVCTANNTVAIISTGGIAKRISQQFALDSRSCVMQCLLPYGAQLLMASGLSKLSPAQIIPYLYYPFALAVCVLFTIVFRLPRRYS